MQFINNTVVSNSATGKGGGMEIDYQATDHLDFYNNIIFNNTVGAGEVGKDVFVVVTLGSGTANLFNNDLTEICFASSPRFVCDPTAVAGLSQGGEINTDPMLIDPTNGNFNLAAGSQAINAGDPNAPALPTTDHDGNPRVIGPAPDMGALEAPLPATSGGGNGGNGGNSGGSGEPVSGSGCALQSGTPATWSGLLAAMLLLPLGILRIRRRS